MKKIYLSKSRQCNLGDITSLIKSLFNYDVEILEFSGGKYSPETLLSSDIVIMFPPINSSAIDLDSYCQLNFFIGKGLYDECNYAYNDNIPVYIYNNNEFYEFDYTCIEDESNWQNKYGIFYPYPDVLDFEKFILLNNIKELKEKRKEFNYNLLICWKNG